MRFVVDLTGLQAHRQPIWLQELPVKGEIKEKSNNQQIILYEND